MAKKTSKKKTAAVDVIAEDYDDFRTQANYDDVVYKFLKNYESVRKTIRKTVKDVKELKSVSLKDSTIYRRSTAIKEKEKELLSLRIKRFEHMISFVVSVRRSYKLGTRGGYRRDTFINEFKAYLENVEQWKQMGFK